MYFPEYIKKKCVFLNLLWYFRCCDTLLKSLKVQCSIRLFNRLICRKQNVYLYMKTGEFTACIFLNAISTAHTHTYSTHTPTQIGPLNLICHTLNVIGPWTENLIWLTVKWLKNLTCTQRVCVCVYAWMHVCGLINCISSHFVFIFTRVHFSPLFTKNLSKLINSVSLGRNPSIFRTPNWIDLRGPHLAFSIGAICARFPSLPPPSLWINVKKWQQCTCCRHTTRVPMRAPRAAVQLCNLISLLSLQLIDSHIRALRPFVNL